MTTPPPVVLSGGGLARRVTGGLRLLRAATGLGVDLVLRRGVPLVLGAGPLGRLAVPLVATPGRTAVAVRSDGHDVAPTPQSLDAAFPEASGKLVVFVPGPGDPDDCWDRHIDRVGACYGERLARLLDWTPVRLRCDAGSPADLAIDLASVLQRLVEAWPTDVDRVAVVGHAAGGLALRAASGVLSHSPAPWTERVSDVVLLGTPLLGAPAPRYAVPVGRRLEEQLGGITGPQPESEPLPGVRYTAFTTRAPDAGRAVGRALGDLLWWRHRLGGRHRRARQLFPTASYHEVAAGDLGLVNHPDIHGALVRLLS